MIMGVVLHNIPLGITLGLVIGVVGGVVARRKVPDVTKP
jgi:hypothetical protein